MQEKTGAGTTPDDQNAGKRIYMATNLKPTLRWGRNSDGNEPALDDVRKFTEFAQKCNDAGAQLIAMNRPSGRTAGRDVRKWCNLLLTRV